MKQFFIPTCVAACLAGSALNAAAQASQDPLGNSGAALGSESLGSRAVPAGPVPPLPSGPLTELGNRLRDDGVSLGLTLFNLNSHNPSTGISPGQWANYGMLFFSAGFDLEKLAGISATKLNFTEVVNEPSHNQDNYLFSTGSGFTPFPVITKTTDLVNLTLSHRLLDDKLSLEYGRMNLTRDFMVGNMCSGCLISAQATIMNQPGVSKSAWGMSTRYELDPNSTVGLGLLEDNTAKWQYHSGWDWGHDTAEGYIAMLNYTQRRGFDDVAHPYKLEAGLFHTSASYDDPLYNEDGTSHVEQSSGTPMQHRGRTGAYAHGRQVLWRSERGGYGTPENVAGYGGVVYTPGAGESYPVEAYAGAEWSGFVPQNPLAMLGTTVRYIRLGERRAIYEQQVRAGYTTALNMATGGAVPIVNEALPRNMFLFDVHGRIGLLPGMFVETSLQYLKNPNAMIPATLERIRNGYMFNVSLIMDFGVLSGLVRMPGDKIF